MNTIIQKPITINVKCQNAIGSFRVNNYEFEAIQDQTIFEVETEPLVGGMFMVAINGVLQSFVKGDYTIVGKIITLDQGVDAGDVVFGMYQEE